MHAVTKILIVFCAVFSLLLAALTIAFSANADAFVASHEHAQNQVRAAQADLAAANVTQASERANLEERLQTEQEEARSLRAELGNLRTQGTALRAELEQAKGQAQSNRNQIAQFGATIDTLIELNKNYRDEVNRLRSDALGSSRREIDLVDRLKDLESAREVLEQTARALREQLEEAKYALQAAQTGGPAAGATGEDPFEAIGQLIECSVTRVFTDDAGRELAAISEGTNGGIRENMLLNVVRDGNFLATIQIISADPQQSVGVINKLGRPVVVQQGDRVLSKL